MYGKSIGFLSDSLVDRYSLSGTDPSIRHVHFRRSALYPMSLSKEKGKNLICRFTVVHGEKKIANSKTVKLCKSVRFPTPGHQSSHKLQSIMELVDG